ncbi:hypothetical protein H6F67_05705 [Microcoleus sp. FACHB-1515]|uniref:hypothetical protein n=1 Tax=Cyanophyceae TaxID=3028117 RepID=UPI001686B7A1|nr:hypothetical protein [Microcoleus sp. FACHB-1515]MBD2089346.1 hypothetical protein [Microcoleus sp. FACHB-1515]
MQSKKATVLAMLNLSHWGVVLLFLLLATDVGFIALHLIHAHTSLLTLDKMIPASVFSLETDRGYAELFQYIKQYWIVLLLGLFALRNRSLLYLSWSLLFAFLLLDDAAELHEKLGFSIGQKFAFGSLFGLRPTDFGELCVAATAGVCFFAAIATTHRRSDRAARKVSKTLAMLLLALVFFGIGIDMLHVVLMFTSLNSLLIVLEDGGELIVMSIITSFVLSQALLRKAETLVPARELVRPF